MSAQKDMATAKSVCELAKQVKDPIAKADFEEAAARFEKKAAIGAKKAGRARRKKRDSLARR